MGVALQDMMNRCYENKLRYTVMQAGAGVQILVLERGGRIFGPFLSGKPGLLWASYAWHERDVFRALLEAKEWNVGGDRVWIAPEIQFHIKDRANPENTEKIPAAVDPGSYRMKTLSDVVMLAEDIKLQAYNLASGTAKLRLHKSIRAAANPLRAVSNYADLMNGIAYGGYLQELTLSQRVGSAIAAEAWNITQINPPGEIIIPSTQKADYADYYEPVDAQYLQRYSRYVNLRATGERRFKVGLKAAHVKGDIAFFGEMYGASYLYIKRYFNNPSANYAEEPAKLPGESGFSMHVYNDGGKIGGFAELECNLQPVNGARKTSMDTVYNWFFMGQISKLKQILLTLTGVDSDVNY